MNLQINPYTYIKTPRFGDVEHNKIIDEQWRTWRDAVKAVHRCFAEIVGVLPPRHYDTYLSSTKELSSILNQPTEKLRVNLQSRYLISVRADTHILHEAARRARLCLSGDISINEHGRTAWEQDIYDETGNGKRSRGAANEHDSELFASTEVSTLRARVAELEAEVDRLKRLAS